MTFRSFTTLDELCELLEQRYNIATPENLTSDQLREWTAKKQSVIKIRVINILKTMLGYVACDLLNFILNAAQRRGCG